MGGAEATRGISAWAEVEPDRPALVLDGEVRTYRALDDRSSRLARALAARGAGRGDRVAIMLPNGFEFFEAWLAAAKLGALVVLVNWHLKADELAYILEDSQALVLVTHQALTEPVQAATAAVPAIATLTVGVDYEAALGDAGAEPLRADVLASPVFYTSGTTGRPKGVVHGAMVDDDVARRSVEGQLMLWGWTPSDVNLLCGPAYHAGPGGFVMAALYVGAPTVIMPTWDAREWLALVPRHRVTIAFMTPAHFIRILEVDDAERAAADLSSLRIVVHAGAPCPVVVKRRIIEAFAPAPIWELYGASEGGATRIGPDEWLAHPGSVGVPWPGVEVRILDPAGNPLGPGETGLVYIAPPGGAGFHYHDDPAKTEAAWRDAAFTVGDVGHLDADGYLYLTDRATDMVIRGGVNVYPREVEEVLFTHPAVVDCAVFGVPDDRLGEQLKAMVEVREPVDPEVLRAHVRDRLADYKVPAFVEIVDELPRQANGKVLKRQLRAAHWAGRDRRIG